MVESTLKSSTWRPQRVYAAKEPKIGSSNSSLWVSNVRHGAAVYLFVLCIHSFGVQVKSLQETLKTVPLQLFERPPSCKLR